MAGLPHEAPRRLSSRPGHPDYHPSFLRVGVRINGEEVADCVEYDMDAHTAQRRSRGRLQGVIVEPFVRDDHVESRQERRARERWEQSHA